ncbi:YdeI family protein [Sphingosinicella sp. BN140058]|uniref:YdeI/OmpD-associated family protein n=1 Tax=Sphingosinicella sp. BN140058 TaxID=1892855 RepID=UPI001FB0F6E4|nr:YdeI/OmpD-associated family protein [Sphingosinicella sp. BN140058]
MIHDAAALIEAGRAPRPRPEKADLPMPEDLAAALAARPPGAEKFAALSPSGRREYLEWILEAKRPETRAKRIAEAAEWIAEGKRRNWKYERKSS